MDAIYNMEKHDFEEALNNLLKAKLIFEQIASYQDTLEALIYGEKVNQLSTFIRSCAATLSLGNADEIAHGDAAKWTKDIKTAQGKLTSASTSEDTEMTSGNSQLKSEVKINGRVIPLKSIKLREAFASLTEIEKEITALKA